MTDDLNPSGADDIDVAMVLAAYAAFAKGDIDAAVANLHPDVEWIEPDEFPNGGRHVGPAAVGNYLRQSRAMWSEFTSTPTAFGRGRRIVVFHHVTGMLQDGAAHENTVADVFTVEDGLVTHLQAYADPADAIQTG
jgi:ketosteroid isomerase-like protein